MLVESKDSHNLLALFVVIFVLGESQRISGPSTLAVLGAVRRHQPYSTSCFGYHIHAGMESEDTGPNPLATVSGLRCHQS